MAEEPSRDDRHGDVPEQTSRDPWRVEGSGQTGQQQPGGKAGATATWITVLVILGLYVVARVFEVLDAVPKHRAPAKRALSR